MWGGSQINCQKQTQCETQQEGTHSPSQPASLSLERTFLPLCQINPLCGFTLHHFLNRILSFKEPRTKEFHNPPPINKRRGNLGGFLEFCLPCTCTPTWMNPTINGDWKKSGTKEYIMYASICIKCKTKKHWSLVLEVRIVVTLEHIVAGKEQKRLLGADNVLFLHLCAGCMGVFSLWKLANWTFFE